MQFKNTRDASCKFQKWSYASQQHVKWLVPAALLWCHDSIFINLSATLVSHYVSCQETYLWIIC